MTNWTKVYNRLWRLIDTQGPCYFSGPRFLNKLREVSIDVPAYGEFIEQRRAAGKSTTRKDFFLDALMELDDAGRWQVVTGILEEVEHCDPDLVSEIRALMGGAAVAPSAAVPAEAWNAERLNAYLATIDAAIGQGQFDRAVTLSYTCLEGFYGAFYRAKVIGGDAPKELIELAKWIKHHLKSAFPEYPDEVLNLVTQTSHAVDRARNRFSESHFAGEAGRWLATYIRDLANVQIRLLLHFI